jgi:hypothetical protein
MHDYVRHGHVSGDPGGTIRIIDIVTTILCAHVSLSGGILYNSRCTQARSSHVYVPRPDLPYVMVHNWPLDHGAPGPLASKHSENLQDAQVGERAGFQEASTDEDDPLDVLQATQPHGVSGSRIMPAGISRVQSFTRCT